MNRRVILAVAALVSRVRNRWPACRAGHPGWRRYSSLKYSRYSRSSRLASRAPRSGILTTYFVLGTLLALWPGLASAQTRIGLIGYATYGSTSFAAADSFEAVGASGHQQGLGGGVSVTGIWRGLFVDVGVARQKMSGERVFVDAGTVYPLGIPLDISIRPVDLAGGWRLSHGRVSPYVGAGVTFVSYKEQSTFAVSGDDVDEHASGGLFLAGADVKTLSWLSVGGEIRYRKVSGILGSGGVSQVFGDDQLGGVSVALRVTLGL